MQTLNDFHDNTFITPALAACLLKVKDASVRRFVESGAIPRHGRYIRVKDLKTFLANFEITDADDEISFEIESQIAELTRQKYALESQIDDLKNVLNAAGADVEKAAQTAPKKRGRPRKITTAAQIEKEPTTVENHAQNANAAPVSAVENAPLSALNDNEIITLAHAARLLNVTTDRLNTLKKRGLGFIRQNGRVATTAGALKAFLKEHAPVSAVENHAQNAKLEKAAALKAARENAQKPLSALNDNDLITPDHAARILNCKRPSLAFFQKRGALPFIKSGGRVFFTAADVKALLNAREKSQMKKAGASLKNKGVAAQNANAKNGKKVEKNQNSADNHDRAAPKKRGFFGFINKFFKGNA